MGKQLAAVVGIVAIILYCFSALTETNVNDENNVIEVTTDSLPENVGDSIFVCNGTMSPVYITDSTGYLGCNLTYSIPITTMEWQIARTRSRVQLQFTEKTSPVWGNVTVKCNNILIGWEDMTNSMIVPYPVPPYTCNSTMIVNYEYYVEVRFRLPSQAGPPIHRLHG